MKKKRISCFTLLTIPLLLLSLATVAENADNDGDGIPNQVEQVLGTDPAFAEPLQLVGEDAILGNGEKLTGKRKNVPDLWKVYFANVTENRWLWRLDFASKFEGTGANLLLYVDVDDNVKTGRQSGAPGTDLRLMHINGSHRIVIQNDAVCDRNRKLRGFAVGNSLYLCMDFNPKLTDDGKAKLRARVLCQMGAEPSDSDMLEWFSVTCSALRKTPKRSVGCFSQALSNGVSARNRWLGWREDLQAAEPLFLHPDDAKTAGMKRYNLALEPVADSATATWKAPETGEWFLNVLLQDSAVGREQVGIAIDGRQTATLVAAENHGDLVLFSTDTPLPLKRGTEIRLTAAAPAQDFRISEVSLTRKPLRQSPLSIFHLEKYCRQTSTDKAQIDICFLSNYPCLGTVRWGRGSTLDQELKEEKRTYNHLLSIPNLNPGETIRYQVTIKDGGDLNQSTVLEAVASPKRLARCGVRRKRVKLMLKETLAKDLSRPLWPVASGVPIPQGELADTKNCRLLIDGKLANAQFSELARWPDGSVKWVLVSTLWEKTMEAAVLEYGRKIATPPVSKPIVVRDEADSLTVDAGRIKVRLSKTNVRLPGDLWFDGRKIISDTGDGLTLVDGEGRKFTSANTAPARFVIEEQGPVRTVVCVEGPLTGKTGKHLSYRCRLYFYRNFPGLPMVVHLLGDEGKTIFPPTLHPIKRFTLPMQLTAGTDQTRSILQDDDLHFIEENKKGRKETEGRHNGVLSIRTADQQVQLAIKNFWQLYPKGLGTDGQTLNAELFPQLAEDQYADVTDAKQLTINYYWYRNGAYLLPCGTEPSTDLLLYFGAEEDDTLSATFDATLALAPAPKDMLASGAFWDMKPEREKIFPEYAAFVRQGLKNIARKKQGGHWYSWMNYGDTYGERGVNWVNQEYDMQWGMLLQYARNGNPDFLHVAETHARHTACIDQITWSPEPTRMGIQKEHALWHVGGFGTPKIPNAKYWFLNGIYNTGHMWTQGTYAAYCLTGDRRLKDSIDHLTRWMSTHYTTYLERWIHRNYGWSTLVMLGAYGVEPHPHRLNAARLFLWHVCSQQDPGTGVFVHPIQECTHTPKHMGGKTFMTGVEMTALKYMHQLEGNKAYETALRKSADWIYARMWHPEKSGFQYAECPQFDNRASASSINMPCEGLAYLCQLDKDPRYREMLLVPLAKTIRSASSSGKGYATQLRMTGFALSTLEEIGITKLPTPADQPPKLLFPGALHLDEKKETPFAPTISHSWPQTQKISVEVTALPPGLTVKPKRVRWRAKTGVSSGPAFLFEGKADKGAEIRFKCKIGKQVLTASLPVKYAKRVELGKQFGMITGPGDPVFLALQTLNATLPVLPDLKPETLGKYRALIVGSEAHEKGFAGLPREAHSLIEFAKSGGRIAFMQFQDSSYRPEFLPLPTTLSNRKGHCLKIEKPEHPLFNCPAKISSLKGVVSYDTITSADPGWEVLASDDLGKPSILEAKVGKGRILLIQPSPDRYLIKSEAVEDGLSLSDCETLFRNLLFYLQAE